MSPIANIAVIGCGHTGRITISNALDKGYHVRGFEINVALRKRLIQQWEQGHISSLIPTRRLDNTLLNYPATMREALQDAQVAFICVNTPANDDGTVNLEDVYAATSSVIDNCQEHTVLLLRSTVLPGITQNLHDLHQKEIKDKSLTLGFFPEFHTARDNYAKAQNVAHVFIGTLQPKDQNTIEPLLSAIYPQSDIIFQRAQSLEMAKHARNAFLMAKVVFMGEVAQIARTTNADITEIIDCMESDPRIGNGHLQPFLGVGGACLQKDLDALNNSMHNVISTPLLNAIAPANTHYQKQLSANLMSTLQEKCALKNVKSSSQLTKVALFTDQPFVFPKQQSTKYILSSAQILTNNLIQHGLTVTIHNTTQAHLIPQHKPTEKIEMHSCPYTASKDAQAVIFALDSGTLDGDLDYPRLRDSLKNPLGIVFGKFTGIKNLSQVGIEVLHY